MLNLLIGILNFILISYLLYDKFKKEKDLSKFILEVDQKIINISKKGATKLYLDISKLNNKEINFVTNYYINKNYKTTFVEDKNLIQFIQIIWKSSFETFQNEAKEKKIQKLDLEDIQKQKSEDSNVISLFMPN